MKLGENLKRFLPGAQETPEGKIMTFMAIIFGCVVVTSIIITFLVFSIVMKGEPVVSVPSLKNMNLGTAMEELQNYGLKAEVHLRHSKKRVKRGIVFAQKPTSGANMRKGGEVILSVSYGLGKRFVDNYVGKMIDDVISQINNINEMNGEDIIEYHISKQYHKAPANEVIGQEPAMGSVIDGKVKLSLRVSSGLWEQKVTIPDLDSMDFEKAIKILSDRNIPFNFRLRKAKKNEKKGIVIAQNPAKGGKIKVGSFVDLTITSKDDNERQKTKFGLFEKILPSYSSPLDLTVMISVPKNKKRVYYSMKHPGGNVSIPYNTFEGTQFSVLVESKEVASFTVQ